MPIDLKDIIDRVHKPENSDAYHKLINHPSEVSGGKEFLNSVDKAKKLDPQKAHLLLMLNIPKL